MWQLVLLWYLCSLYPQVKQYASGLHQQGHLPSPLAPPPLVPLPLAPLCSFHPLLLCNISSWLVSFFIVAVRDEFVVVNSLIVFTRLSIVSFFRRGRHGQGVE